MALPIIPNIALQRGEELAILAKNQPTGFVHAAFQWVLLKSTGLDTDTAMRDYATLDALLKRGGGSQVAECSFTGYSRLTVATGDIVSTVDNSADDVTIDITTNPSWNPTSVEHTGAIALVFNPDTTAGSNDASCVPMFIDACDETTGTGGAATPLAYVVASGGYDSAVQG